MMKLLRKLFDNRNSNDKGVYADILGSDYTIANIAKIWQNNADDFKLIRTYLITEYAVKGKYTKKEMIAFRQGVTQVLQFLEQTEKDYYNILNNNVNK